MFLVVGLGNPGQKYDKTRHNIGFDVIDAIGEKYNIDINEKKSKGLCGSGYVEGQKVILVKPQTFMNLSGDCVAPLMNFYKLDPETELIVIFDDISLDPGNIRIRAKGSAGGHNGIKNIIAYLGTQVFQRVKIGVGEKPKNYDLKDFVLGHFSKAEQKLMEEGCQHSVQAVELMLEGEIQAAMNEFNRKKREK